MCYGDTSLVRWWNSSYVEPPWNGRDRRPSGWIWTEHYSQSYLAMTGKDQAMNTDLRWDALRQCRDFNSLVEWVRERQLVDDTFTDEFKTPQECAPNGEGEGVTNCNSNSSS